MKEVKFSHIFGGKKLSVTYYEDKRLKKVKGIEKKIFPIYLRIVFNTVTLRVRSILWKRLMESNEFLFSVAFGDTLAQCYGDIENSFIKDRNSFEQVCQYEFEGIKRIVIFATQSAPDDVQQIVNAYNFWGQDGLREISRTIIEKVVNHGIEKVDPNGPTDIRRFEIRKYPPISKGLYQFISDALLTYDPVTLACIIDEINLAEKNGITGELLSDYNTLEWAIGKLIFEFSNFGLTPRPLSLGIIYMPKIHFFYPIGDDFSKKKESKPLSDEFQVADFLSLRRYISKKE